MNFTPNLTITLIGFSIIIGIVIFNLAIKPFIKDPKDDFGGFFNDNFNQ